MARHLRANFAILGVTAQLVMLGLMATATPTSAQGFFGNWPPRPPSSVPNRSNPGRTLPPPPDQYQGAPDQYPPPTGQYQSAPGQYPPQSSEHPAQLEQLPPPPPPTAAAPLRGPGVESQPLPPPPGGLSDPGRAPAGSAPQPALLPPNSGAPQTPPAPAGPPIEEVVTEPPSQKIPNPTAVFSGLDKITGRITKFEVAINETVQFGALRVRPRACYTRPPTEAPNTTGFIEVDEVTLQGEVKRLFRGWMFAASPGLHGVEHPIYDVWLSDCKGAQTAAVEEPVPTPPPQPAQRSQPTPPSTGAARRSAPQRR
jgi:hypothetical protein